ncbi:Histidine kinase-, DNA gyrase B-, and HSP90-like ATPase [Allopseudospirillum japonicum]|uniref:histidine kinase n=1 Tax=Allopseudospirillum japonicum TaxID=64971 RepID=A0A1H6TTZ7_9GAMM|nr:response regulator [Allopseudospirillum japonicum]SEI83548.1 Histidine kinase-, DNA gyrase B-, and HSP90-like ATPase [Allopseudospirillum japonicum]
MDKKILVVDDDSSQLRLYQYCLTQAGYEVICALDGMQGLQYWQAHQPSFVIMDIELPDMTGYEVVANIRSQQGAWVPIIFATSFDDELHRQQALTSGGDDYIVKPISVDKLLHRLGLLEEILEKNTALKLHTEHLARLQENLALIASQGHEFNNLLASIQGLSEVNLQLLEEGSTPYKNQQQILLAGDRAQMLIERLGYGQTNIDVKKDYLNISDFLQEIHALLSALVKPPVRLAFQIENIGLQIFVDRDYLLQVLVNLIRNAYHACRSCNLGCDSQKREYRIQVVLAKCDDHALIQVIDQGCGMSATSVQNMLRPFYTTKNHTQGMGLGMMLVQSFVEHHQARLQVQSELSQGTHINLLIPLIEMAP